MFSFFRKRQDLRFRIEYEGKRFDITVSRLSLKKSKCPGGTIFL